MPKVVIALSRVGCRGGHSLHVVCDLSLASAESPVQADGRRCRPFDGGFGSAYLAVRSARSSPGDLLLGETYGARTRTGWAWSTGWCTCRTRVGRAGWAGGSAQEPDAVRMLKFAFNAIDDGLIGQQVFA